ncbi:MAG: hypothetical protein QME66_01555 [Candidatus Eisenbacteria bacterium]|nr:hypothetical protein [Candidatus Eisenbacteria bacterium]
MMKKMMVVMPIMILWAFSVFADTNSLSPFPPEWPAPGKHEVGEPWWGIIVYTDDAYNWPPAAITALNNLGYGYTWYDRDPVGFETELQERPYFFRQIFVSHCTYYELSYAWDEILALVEGHTQAGIETFDGDCSHDHSGAGRALFERIGAGGAYDFGPTDLFLSNSWRPSFWEDLNGIVIPWTGNLGYIDNGDIAGWLLWASCSLARWHPSGSTNGALYQLPPCSWVGFWILDHNYPYNLAVHMWEVRFRSTPGTAAETETWGKIKAMFR